MAKTPDLRTEPSDLDPFIADFAPLFFQRAITYVDVGAFRGRVYKDLVRRGPRIIDAHLIEASPVNLEDLRRAVGADHRVAVHGVALGDHEGKVTMLLRNTMSKVVEQATEAQKTAEVPLTTLDSLMEREGVDHIHLLKVDVEGSELAVLRGANRLLKTHAIDVIYIEAGMSGDSDQQVHHREIEEILEPLGYRMMGVYEQKNEWIDDLPTLRRANIGFISQTLAQSTPYALSRELMSLRQQAERDASQLAEFTKELKRRKEALAKEHQSAAEHLAHIQRERKAHQTKLAEVIAERDAFATWGTETDLRLRRVLASRWWNITRIPRAVLRRLRVRLGKPVMAPIIPLPKPKTADRIAVSSQSDPAAAVLRAAGLRNPSALYETMRELLKDGADPQAWLVGQFASICFDYNATAYANVVRVADAMRERYGSLTSAVPRSLGEQAYVTFVTNIAKSYGRLGQTEAALGLLTEAIELGYGALAAVRAEVAFASDPEAAIADLSAAIDAAPGPAGKYDRRQFMLAHLLLDGTRAVEDVEVTNASPDIEIARAIDAHRRGDGPKYRGRLNAYFEACGLVPVFLAGDGPITGNGFESPPPTPSPHDDVVTVIMTTFNSQNTVEAAINSLLAQSHSALEILVVDDASTDSTVERVEHIAKRDPRVRLLKASRNGGTYAAKNSAIAQAKGEYVTFHDSDDWAHPQRIERHLDFMIANPGVMATRSDWLRIASDGDIEVRRWGMTAPHPNPASTFIRREVVEIAGVFDPVRFGADSEYWFRLQALLPARSVRSLKLTLGIGSHHPASLTRSGPGAWSDDHYSAVRSAYRLSWTEFHATANAHALAYREGAPRNFWAPESMLRAPDDHPMPGTRAPAYPLGDESVPGFLFAISMASKAASQDWDTAQDLLDRTLHSVVAQSDPRWRAIVCGHERPDLKILDDPRITFIESPRPVPNGSSDFRADKGFKRRIIATEARWAGGGYFFPLDADDLVHRDVVKHVLADDNRRGYVMTTGYAEDYQGGRLAPIPGAWTLSFDRVCGSAIVLYFEPDDLPTSPESKDKVYFDLFSHHAYWAGTAEEYRGPLDPIPFPAGVYALNTGQNISFVLQRANRRGTHIVEMIHHHALPDRSSILRDEFGQG